MWGGDALYYSSELIVKAVFVRIVSHISRSICNDYRQVAMSVRQSLLSEAYLRLDSRCSEH